MLRSSPQCSLQRAAKWKWKTLLFEDREYSITIHCVGHLACTQIYSRKFTMTFGWVKIWQPTASKPLVMELHWSIHPVLLCNLKWDCPWNGANRSKNILRVWIKGTNPYADQNGDLHFSSYCCSNQKKQSHKKRRIHLRATEYHLVRNSILKCWMHPNSAS